MEKRASINLTRSKYFMYSLRFHPYHVLSILVYYGGG